MNCFVRLLYSALMSHVLLFHCFRFWMSFVCRFTHRCVRACVFCLFFCMCSRHNSPLDMLTLWTCRVKPPFCSLVLHFFGFCERLPLQWPSFSTAISKSSSNLLCPCINRVIFIPLQDRGSGVCFVYLQDAKCLPTTLNWLWHRWGGRVGEWGAGGAELPRFLNQVMTNSPECLQCMTHKDMIFEMLMRWRLYRVEAQDRAEEEWDGGRDSWYHAASFCQSWQSRFPTECIR